MIWFILLIYSVTAYNMAFWLVYKDGPFGLFNGIRNLTAKISPSFANVFDCMNCTSTWCGFILSALNTIFLPSILVTPMGLVFGDTINVFIRIFLDGMCTSGIVYLIHTAQEMMEGKSNG